MNIELSFRHLGVNGRLQAAVNVWVNEDILHSHTFDLRSQVSRERFTKSLAAKYTPGDDAATVAGALGYVSSTGPAEGGETATLDIVAITEFLRQKLRETADAQVLAEVARKEHEDDERRTAAVDKAKAAPPDAPSGKNVVEWPEPLRLAEHYLTTVRDRDERVTLKRYREEWWEFVGAGYTPVSDEEQHARLYRHLDTIWTPERKPDGTPTGEIIKVVPRSNLIREVSLAMPSRDLIVTGEMPQWIGGKDNADPVDIVAFRNGLLNVAAYKAGDDGLSPPTPDWFSCVACPYDFDPDAKCPLWIRTLDDIFDGDAESIALLQEYMGYLLVPDNRYEKLLMLAGKSRGGKGTILSATTSMLGAQQVASTSFRSLGSRFGLHPLLGKLAAILPDAHIGRSTDEKAAVEVLKAVTGNDDVAIDRKGVDALPNVRLISRFLIAVNDLPKLPDEAGALKLRLLMLVFTKTFAGKEDKTLKRRLHNEAPGIAVWALNGLCRLRENDEFTIPERSRLMVEAFERLVSPVLSFIDECCELSTSADTWVEKIKLYDAWATWCKERKDDPGNLASFGQKLINAAQTVTPGRLGPDGQRFHVYRNIRLCSV